jgi:enterochelin esterase-like enzyme
MPQPPPVTTSPRIARLVAELAAGDAGAVERLWADAATAGTPLLEDRGGGACTVTFLWRDRHGAAAGTTQVVLIANRLTDPSAWAQSVLDRVPGTDVWHRSYRLPDRWRATYQLAPEDGRGGARAAAGAAARWRGLDAAVEADPLNPRTLREKDGTPASIAELPGAPSDRWARPAAGVPRGTLDVLTVPSAALGAARRVWCHRPAGLAATDAAGAAVLVLLDGEDWVTRLDGPAILDALAAAGAIPPTVTLLVDSVDTAHRSLELAAHPPFLAFVADELLPWAQGALGVPADPRRTFVAGQSLGGLSALTLLLDRPGRFAGALAQSASLWWRPPATDRDGTEHHSHTAERCARLAPGPRVVLAVGTQEWALLEQHRDLERTLRAAGHDVHYGEFCGGHEALCWRAGLGDGLRRLLGAAGP